MLQLHNISKSFGPLKVLDQVSLTIPDGAVTAIVGPSGAGKTTLLQIAGTLALPDSGRVTYDGVEVTSLNDRRLSEFRNRHIGFVFQAHQLLPEFTAQENVALPAMIAGETKSVSMKRAAVLLEELGLSERLRHKPAALSGGERQRVAIARALINSPRVVLADEPTGALDSANRDEIMRLIASLREERGQTFVIVTHDHAMAATADNVVSMADGRIIEGEKDEETT